MTNLINGRTPEQIKYALGCGADAECDNCAYCSQDFETMVHGFCCNKVTKDAIALIEHLEAKQPTWISVKERLPEEAGKYIVCTRKKAVYCTAFRYFHGKGYFATDTTTHITHWMPLPEPPEEENV